MKRILGILAGAALAVSTAAFAQAPHQSTDVRPDVARSNTARGDTAPESSSSNGAMAPSDRMDRSAQASPAQPTDPRDQHDPNYRAQTTHGDVADKAAGAPSTGATQLTGRVVRADNKMLWLEHMGAVVPLKLDRSTQMQGLGLKNARDLKEGQEVRAQFEVMNKTVNVAKSIQLVEQKGTGGSGLTVPDESLHNAPLTTPDVHNSGSLQRPTPMNGEDTRDNSQINPNGY